MVRKVAFRMDDPSVEASGSGDEIDVPLGISPVALVRQILRVPLAIVAFLAGFAAMLTFANDCRQGIR